MSSLSRSALALLLGALGGSALAATPYVEAGRVQATLVLATPPAVGSAQSLAELAELKQLQANRSAAQIARAQADEQDESIFAYRDVIGAGFTAAALPLTAALSARVDLDEDVNTGPLKQGYARVRPYNVDKELHPVCKTKTRDDSYPSGHSTAGYLEALTLAELLPEKRDAILARADEYAHNRLVCGVHFPSDIAAGKLLAYTVHALARTNPQYVQDVAAARVELRKALGYTN